MPAQVPPSDEQIRDLEILLKAHHPLIFIETDDPDRAVNLLAWVCDRLAMPLAHWSSEKGLYRTDFEVKKVLTKAIVEDQCLDCRDIARVIEAKKDALTSCFSSTCPGARYGSISCVCT